MRKGKNGWTNKGMDKQVGQDAKDEDASRPKRVN